MRRVITSLASPSTPLFKRCCSTYTNALQAIDTICGQLDAIDLEEFRRRAFVPENPVLITPKHDTNRDSVDTIKLCTFSIPAAVRWFSLEPRGGTESSNSSQILVPNQQYLSPFGAAVLPYELIVDQNIKSSIQNIVIRTQGQDSPRGILDPGDFLGQFVADTPAGTFHRFNAPLSLFLQVCRLKSNSIQRLYIAQAQIADLPKQLQDDLPIPRLVKEAGKGDIYDSNIWMGIPPTYTPLHKDPNPNLFVQLASSKRVRIFRPDVGAAMFRNVQQRISKSSPCSFRGEEMMEGPELDALDEAVWSRLIGTEGFEAIVSPGDGFVHSEGVVA